MTLISLILTIRHLELWDVRNSAKHKNYLESLLKPSFLGGAWDSSFPLTAWWWWHCWCGDLSECGVTLQYSFGLSGSMTVYYHLLSFPTHCLTPTICIRLFNLNAVQIGSAVNSCGFLYILYSWRLVSSYVDLAPGRDSFSINVLLLSHKMNVKKKKSLFWAKQLAQEQKQLNFWERNCESKGARKYRYFSTLFSFRTFLPQCQLRENGHLFWGLV